MILTNYPPGEHVFALERGFTSVQPGVKYRVKAIFPAGVYATFFNIVTCTYYQLIRSTFNIVITFLLQHKIVS